MACNQTLSGLAKDCSTSKGGILEVYIANHEDVTAIADESGKVTTITMASSKKFKRYHVNKNTCSMNSTYNLDQAAGVRYVQTDLVLNFTRMETSKRIEMTALAMNDLIVIVRDANNVFWLLGKDEPVNASTGTAVSGTQRTDRNGYSITLQDNSDEMPFEVAEGIIEGLVD